MGWCGEPALLDLNFSQPTVCPLLRRTFCFFTYNSKITGWNRIRLTE
jgi:hypothetical protein